MNLNSSNQEDAESLRAEAESLINQGHFSDALVILDTIREKFPNDNNIIIETTASIVEIYSSLGDYERASDEAKCIEEMVAPKIQDISNFIKDTDVNKVPISQIPDILKRLRNIGTSYYVSRRVKYSASIIKEYSGKLDEAEIFFRSLLSEYEQQIPGIKKLTPNMIVGQDKLVPIIGIKKHLAEIMLKKSHYQEGLMYADQIEPYFRKNKNLRPKLAAILKVQADALLKLEKVSDAIDKLEEGIKDLEQYNDPNLLWQLQWHKGRALYIMGKQQDALYAYSQAIKTVNDLRKVPMGYRLDSTYLRDKLELFEAAIDLTCRSNYDVRLCCQFIEFIKSRTLTATLSIPSNQQSHTSSELKRKFNELSMQLQDKEERLQTLEFVQHERWGILTADEAKNRKSILNGRATLLERRATLLEKIRITEPRWRSLTEPTPLDLDKVNNILKDRGQSALNLFYRSDKVVVAVLIRDSEVSASKIAVTKEIERKLEDYHQNLQRPIDDQKKEWYDLSKGLGISAEHVVPSELLSQALQSKSLVIVPHGILHLLPWAGLTFNGKMLFEYCPIGILPNLSCILTLKANFSFRPQVALIGYSDYGPQDKDNKNKDLPWTQLEIEELEGIYYFHSGIIEKSMKDKEATEENFWKLANSQNAEGGILHIACHGKFDFIDPMNSGLLLTNSKVDAAEIAMSSLKFNEVILSACRTGIRPTQVQNVKLIADDIIGLPGAFLEAGVKSLLVSIPPSKDDVAFTFMVLYHKNRLAGRAPLFALQETQKTMLNEYSMHQPYNWIGFTIYGYQ